MNIEKILGKDRLEREDLVTLLSADRNQSKPIFEKAAEIKKASVGNKVYLRGLVEISNKCFKDCLYCGIRNSAKDVKRYFISDHEILESVKYAHENQFASVVFQSGEDRSRSFQDRISHLLAESKRITDGKIGITLSCGEQTLETYQRWFESGAHRYLLRIESSNRDLYRKIHPFDSNHDYDARIQALKNLKNSGYQTGTGVMIGLPFQKIEDLADDLIFMREMDIHMCGMGPYIEHRDTPLYTHRKKLMPMDTRFDLTLRMIALLRIIMKDINIAATTALQAIKAGGREMAVESGANVMMPNITPGRYQDDYALYENKPVSGNRSEDSLKLIQKGLKESGHSLGFSLWGDSPHYKKSMGNKA